MLLYLHRRRGLFVFSSFFLPDRPKRLLFQVREPAAPESLSSASLNSRCPQSSILSTLIDHRPRRIKTLWCDHLSRCPSPPHSPRRHLHLRPKSLFLHPDHPTRAPPSTPDSRR